MSGLNKNGLNKNGLNSLNRDSHSREDDLNDLRIYIPMPKSLGEFEELVSKNGWLSYRQNIERYKLLLYFINSYRQGLKTLTGFDKKNIPKKVITSEYNFRNVNLKVKNSVTRTASHKQLFDIIEDYLRFGSLQLDYYGNNSIKSFIKYRNKTMVSVDSIIRLYKDWYSKNLSKKELKQQILKPEISDSLEKLVSKGLRDRTLSLIINIQALNELLKLISNQIFDELRDRLALVANDYVIALELSKVYHKHIEELENALNERMGILSLNPNRLKCKVTRTIPLEELVIVRHVDPNTTIEWGNVSKLLFGYVKPSKRKISEKEHIPISGELGALMEGQEKHETLSKAVLRLYKPKYFDNECFIMINGLKKRIQQLSRDNTKKGVSMSAFSAL